MSCTMPIVGSYAHTECQCGIYGYYTASKGGGVYGEGQITHKQCVVCLCFGKRHYNGIRVMARCNLPSPKG